MPKNTQVMLMKDLSVELGSNKVLDSVNLAMMAGERLAIVGHQARASQQYFAYSLVCSYLLKEALKYQVLIKII